jgi:putative ABC transport system permease protein
MTHLLQDLRVGWRSLWRNPGFAWVVVIIMGLGIGANTMVFNLVNGFLLRSWPYVDAAKNVLVRGTRPKQNQNDLVISYQDLLDIQRRSKSFAQIGGYTETQAYLTLGAEPERFGATMITPRFFSVYAATPIRGREFLPEEGEKSRALTVVMISHRIWTERMQSDPAVIGKTLKMNGRVRTIIGVAPPGFRYPETSDFFVPAYADPEDTRDRRWLHAVARLRDGVSFKQANAEAAAIGADLARAYPDADRGTGLRLVREREGDVDTLIPMLALMMTAVVFVLLIVCANVANLMLARGAGRQREIALRFALGATRGRVIRQLLTESLILSMLGGALGLLLAIWARDLMLSSITEELPFWMKFDTDPNMVLFMLGVSVLAAVLSGLTPALQTSQVDVHEALKDGGQHGSTGRGRNRLRATLVVAEISLALVLLAGAGLMVRSFLHLAEQRSAIKPDGVLTATFTMPVAVYPGNQAKMQFMDRVMPAIAALPGVRAVSSTQDLPLGRSTWSSWVWIDGDPVGPDAPRRAVFLGIVRPDYFRALGIPMRSGRDFTLRDDTLAAKVAIVSETAARTLWPGKDAVGQRFKWGPTDTTGWTTVVGVVGDVMQSIRNQRPPAQFYVPHMQETHQSVTLVVKHDGDPGPLAAAIRRTLKAQDPDMPLYDVQTMNEAIRHGLWENRIWLTLMTTFAILALVIAAIGIYGVMAYSVAQRTQEIGIRMALGAARADVLRMIVGQAMRLTLIGIGIGLAGAFAVTRLMASMLFGVSPSDPPTFVGVTVILALSSVVAAWLPADRATRVDPMVALRSE